MTYAVFTDENSADLAQQALLKLYREVRNRFDDNDDFDGFGEIQSEYVYARNGVVVVHERVRWSRPRPATVGGNPVWVFRIPTSINIGSIPLLQMEITTKPIKLVQFTGMNSNQLDLIAASVQAGKTLDPQVVETFTIADWSRIMIAAMGITFTTVPNGQVTL